MTDDEVLFTTEKAATFLNVSQEFLENDRKSEVKIPFFRRQSRAISYKKSDLLKYVDRRG